MSNNWKRKRRSVESIDKARAESSDSVHQSGVELYIRIIYCEFEKFGIAWREKKGCLTVLKWEPDFLMFTCTIIRDTDREYITKQMLGKKGVYFIA